MQLPTLRVFWRGKFKGEYVQINEADFNPELHRKAANGPWPEDVQKQTANGEDAPLPIPGNFPGAKPLADAGITIFPQLAGKTLEELTAITGIGQATAKAIIAELAKQ